MTLEIEVDGQKWELSPWSIGELKLIAETEVRKLRQQGFRDALDILQESDVDDGKARVLLRMMDGVLKDVVVDNQEASMWLSSPSGQVVCLENSLKPHHPEANRDTARELYHKLTAEDQQRLESFYVESRDILAELEAAQEELAGLKDELARLKGESDGAG